MAGSVRGLMIAGGIFGCLVCIPLLVLAYRFVFGRAPGEEGMEMEMAPEYDEEEAAGLLGSVVQSGSQLSVAERAAVSAVVDAKTSRDVLADRVARLEQVLETARAELDRRDERVEVMTARATRQLTGRKSGRRRKKKGRKVEKGRGGDDGDDEDDEDGDGLYMEPTRSADLAGRAVYGDAWDKVPDGGRGLSVRQALSLKPEVRAELMGAARIALERSGNDPERAAQLVLRQAGVSGYNGLADNIAGDHGPEDSDVPSDAGSAARYLDEVDDIDLATPRRTDDDDD